MSPELIQMIDCMLQASLERWKGMRGIGTVCNQCIYYIYTSYTIYIYANTIWTYHNVSINAQSTKFAKLPGAVFFRVWNFGPSTTALRGANLDQGEVRGIYIQNVVLNEYVIVNKSFTKIIMILSCCVYRKICHSLPLGRWVRISFALSWIPALVCAWAKHASVERSETWERRLSGANCRKFWGQMAVASKKVSPIHLHCRKRSCRHWGIIWAQFFAIVTLLPDRRAEVCGMRYGFNPFKDTETVCIKCSYDLTKLQRWAAEHKQKMQKQLLWTPLKRTVDFLRSSIMPLSSSRLQRTTGEGMRFGEVWRDLKFFKAVRSKCIKDVWRSFRIRNCLYLLVKWS